MHVHRENDWMPLRHQKSKDCIYRSYQYYSSPNWATWWNPAQSRSWMHNSMPKILSTSFRECKSFRLRQFSSKTLKLLKNPSLPCLCCTSCVALLCSSCCFPWRSRNSVASLGTTRTQTNKKEQKKKSTAWASLPKVKIVIKGSRV